MLSAARTFHTGSLCSVHECDAFHGCAVGSSATAAPGLPAPRHRAGVVSSVRIFQSPALFKKTLMLRDSDAQPELSTTYSVGWHPSQKELLISASHPMAMCAHVAAAARDLQSANCHLSYFTLLLQSSLPWWPSKQTMVPHTAVPAVPPTALILH